MKLRKHLRNGAATAGLAVLGLVSSAQAVVPIGSQIGSSIQKSGTAVFGGQPSDFALVIIQLLNFLLSFMGIIFLLLLIYAGYVWMLARGNEEEVAKAKKIATEAVFGIIIILTARITTEFILRSLGEVTA